MALVAQRYYRRAQKLQKELEALRARKTSQDVSHATSTIPESPEEQALVSHNPPPQSPPPQTKPIGPGPVSSSVQPDVAQEFSPLYPVVVEFRRSSSANFEFALEEAKKFPTFSQEGKVYRVTLHSPEDLIQAVHLIYLIERWKGAVIYVGNQRYSPREIFAFVRCYKERMTSYRPALYCFGLDDPSYYRLNLWGCHQSGLLFRSGSKLWTYGRWLNKRGDWAFDKERILHELRRELWPYRYCPALDWSIIEPIVQAFPDRVNPYRDPNWRFVRSWNDMAPGLRVRVIESRFGVEFEDEFIAIGVEPATPAALQKILARARVHLDITLPKQLPS